MLAIIILISLLSLAQASLKTPRTAISASPSLSSIATASVIVASSSSTSTASTLSSSSSSSSPFSSPSSSTIPACNIHPSHSNKTRPSFPYHTGTAPIPTRSAARLSGSVVYHLPTGTAGNGPRITPSPEFHPPGGNFHEIGVKFVQTTYWSCVTFPLETHCGWHEPILDAGVGRVGCDGGGQAALRAGIVAGVVAGGLVLGM